MNELVGAAIFMGIPLIAGTLAAAKTWLEYRKDRASVPCEPVGPWAIVTYFFLSPVLVQVLTRVASRQLQNAQIVSTLFMPVLAILLLPAGLGLLFFGSNRKNWPTIAALQILGGGLNILLMLALL